MTSSSSSGGPDAASARAAAVSVAVRARPRRWFAGQTSRRLAFGYLLLAPAVLYVMLLVGAPFLFSLFLALSDASVADTTASFVGLENFRAAFESDVFFIALRNSIGFTVVAAVFKGLLGTSLAFLLLQPFWGKKFIRGLVVVPMIAPILLIGFLFDTVFTLSDLGVVYLLTQGGPANATKILPVLAYQVGIQAGALGRGAAIALFLFPLLLPLMILMLRNLKRREY